MNKMLKTDEIRQLYLDFFKSKGHEAVGSDSLVPKDDPTLLFTGAGMNQFKEQFMGRNVTYKRATTCQKCIRTGDLDNVGRTSGHHTFFEMLGNFSFGDYFKKEAIMWAWEFLTEKLMIDPDRLWPSIYKDDEEAYAIWRDVVKIPEGRIVRMGEKDNFWPSEAPSKGPNGPCGPCSEIYYDYGANIGCGKPDCDPRCNCGRFVEIWNLVFTQFDRQSDGSLKPLPNKNIDTGMGLERLTSVMQGVKTNFETDIFKTITDEIRKKIPNSQSIKTPKVNAIADHIRAVTFMICDGAMPSNEERGYVVRKLIRRALSHAQDIGIKEPFLYKLVNTVIAVMGGAYPELKEKRDDIAQVVKKEEDAFLFVIETQLPKVEETFRKMDKGEDAGKIAEIAFNFYDTYGMPYEMLEDIANRAGFKIDAALFESLLEKQRQLSRSKSKIKGEIFSETFEKKVAALGIKTQFIGYDHTEAEVKIVAVLGEGQVILDKTPFYGESGGQVGDCGTIEGKTGSMRVEDARKIGDTIVHTGKMIRGEFQKGESVKAAIDVATRRQIMANHTATHLLQAALRKVLGDHVHQTGSFVDSDHLRFDFSHIKKLEDRELSRVEELVNDEIKKGITVTKEIKDIDTAKREGAMALFGEKYDKEVRVVLIGDVSKELCGGTHIENTKEIGIFKIARESSVASGVRRIEAVTGSHAEEWLLGQKKAEEERLKQEARKEEEKKAAIAKIGAALEKVDEYIAKGVAVGSSQIIISSVSDMTMDGLRSLSDKIRGKQASAVLVLASSVPEKVSFVVSVTDDLVKKGINAGLLAREIAGKIDGSGGGKPNFAQGGGKTPSKLEDAFKKTFEILKERLK